MPGDYFLQCVESLAAALEGDEEQMLQAYQEQIANLPPARRRAIRRHFVTIIGGLSRLEMRLKESDGR
ncbi:MAG TPA: hypothetical protein VKB78_07075 [Pirellulales bacterium]|nr:hypothetical protein [Pirellulales bacterium]